MVRMVAISRATFAAGTSQFVLVTASSMSMLGVTMVIIRSVMPAPPRALATSDAARSLHSSDLVIAIAETRLLEREPCSPLLKLVLAARGYFSFARLVGGFCFFPDTLEVLAGRNNLAGPVYDGDCVAYRHDGVLWL